MKFTIILTLILISVLTSSYCQTEEDKKSIEQETLIALKKWFDNPTMNNELLDPAIIKELQDSGRTVNGLKEGLWVEYSLDTLLMGQQTELFVGNKKMPMTFSATLQKETGKYLKGEKDGVWILYKSNDKKPPFYWNRNTVLNYNMGIKDGKEIIYQGYGIEYQKPFIIRHWENDIENGIGEIYDYNSPYNLQKTYNAVNGQMWLMEAYYPNGQLQIKYTDTIIKGQKLKYFKEYFESGQLKGTGFYLNGEQLFGIRMNFYENGKTESIANYADGKLNGNYKYFHDNEQLWTERIYKGGYLLEVNSNYNRKGKRNNPGTIKNGTGTVNIYDTDGKLTKTKDYVDGQEKKGSR
jgi:antitoxin component YwqK of YwqJK toxin-antitoxin module